MSGISPDEHPDPPDISPLKVIRSRAELAHLLNITDRGLCYVLYAMPEADRYVNFEIPKKNGDSRTIKAPNPRLKALQRRLLKLLEPLYSPNSAVYGFAKGRSILGNADRHVRKRFVLNIDLKDFFQSVNFGRVRGLLMARPYELAEDVATVVAQICCYENGLPQGAPTSPLISNMICGRLDFQLSRLSRKYRCRYTRYADDITISSGATEFPQNLASFAIVDGKERTVLSRSLATTITSNGFLINDAKVRLQKSNQRQVVTGLVTNKKSNLRREFVRNVRAMLFRWDTDGIAKCQEDFHWKYRNAETGSFKDTLKGRIDFIGSIRGRDDLLYLRLLNRLISLEPSLVSPGARQAVRSAIDRPGAVLDELWIIESMSNDEKRIDQSTGFYLRGFGIVTCAHGIHDPLQIEVYKRNGLDRQSASLLKLDESLDLAILEIADFPADSFPISFAEPLSGDRIRVLGFPHFGPGSSGTVVEGTVTGKNVDPDGNPLVITDANILYGNSGGPVFDREWNVIGVAARGNRTDGIGEERNFNRFIPISSLFRIGK